MHVMFGRCRPDRRRASGRPDGQLGLSVDRAAWYAGRPARLLWGHATKLLLVPVIVLMVGAAYTSILIGKRQHALQQVSRYNITWFSSQAVSELARLQQTIAGSAIPGSGIDGDEVQLRLDVLANRVGIFQSGIAEIEDLLRADPEFRDTIRELADSIDNAQQLLPVLEAQVRSAAS